MITQIVLVITVVVMNSMFLVMSGLHRHLVEALAIPLLLVDLLLVESVGTIMIVLITHALNMALLVVFSDFRT